MSGEKSETEDTASWPKSPSGETAPAKTPEAPEAAIAPAGDAASKDGAKVSALEGLTGLNPRSSLQAEPTKLPDPSDLKPENPATEAKPAAEGPAKPLDEAVTFPATASLGKSEPAGGAFKAEAAKADAAPLKPASQSKSPPLAEAAPATPSPSSAATVAKPRRGGLVAPLIGGILAAGLGFGLAHYVPDGWPIGPGADRLSALQRQIEAQEARIAELSARAAAPAPDDTLAPRLAALEAKAAEPADLSALQAEVEALKSSLATLPEGGAPADLTPLRTELSQQIDALKAEIAAIPRSNPADLEALREAAKAERDAIEARAEATRAEAEATARAAMIRGAVLRVQAALETGSAFDAALSDLGAVGVALPSALSSHASGVPALSTLQARFPEAARSALAASSRPGPEAGIGDRFTAFLSAQTGLRSLTPQEGATPDAVLSRAEAAVEAGDLAKALSELDALPPEGAAALADWRSGAEARLAASAAAQSLIADLDKP